MSEKILSTVYIDEAGDLGENRGSRWFVVSAVIVDKINEPKIRKSLAQIRAKLNVNEVHMRKIKEFQKRAYAINVLKEEDFTFISVLLDTSRPYSGLTPLLCYNYSCRLLLERVSWYLRDTNREAKIVLSSRGTSRDGELIDYINKLIDYPENAVAHVFLGINAKSPSQWELLQLADVCATSIFLCYEVNGFGFRLPCFATALRRHIYNKNGKIDRYGIKFYNDNMIPSSAEMEALKICSRI